MAIRCIALDLDRTTLNAEGRLSEGNREALLSVMRQGVHVVAASGRCFDALPEDIVNLPGIEYAITSNGAAVWHMPTGKQLQGYTMTPQSIHQILALTGQEEGIFYEAFVRGEAYGDVRYVSNPVRYGTSPQSVAYIQSTRQKVNDMPLFLQEHQEELDSVDIIVHEEGQKQKLWERLRSEVPDLYITSSVKQLIELSHKDAGKQSGVRCIMELLGITREEVAAFGDGDNDADMLAFVGTGIAMANASQKCKEAADYVTLAHDEDGVAYGIRNYLNLQGEAVKK